MLLAFTPTNVAWILALIVLVAWIVYALFNNRAARPELGSEIELAANRKPYLSDEQLEGPRLERVQLLGVLFLAIIAVGLPLYWVFEPHRQAGAVENIADIRADEWGAHLFAPTAEGGFDCAGCHGPGGVGGVAQSTITDPVTGEVRVVNFIAPALNNITYRYSDAEITKTIVYGRPGTPMAGWGAAGGGPMTTQNIETLVEYIHRIQIPRENCAPEHEGDPNCPSGHLPAEVNDEIQAAAERAIENGEAGSLGEALFNLDLAGGAYNCARCHTPGWNYGEPGESGAGRLGPSLTGGTANVRFGSTEALIDFLATGTDDGVGYGVTASQGSGRMPGFGSIYTPEQLAAIAEYVQGL